MEINIRPATAADAPLIATTFAMALGEEATRMYCGDNYLDVLEEIILSDGTQYNYHNVLVAEADSKAVGASIGYDGGDLRPLRDRTFDVIRKYRPDIKVVVDETSAGEFYIDTLAVLPQYQGHGIGRRLLQSMIDRAKGLGFDTVGLLVDTENPGAERLYGAMGFSYVGPVYFLGHEMRHMQRHV